MPLFKHTVLGVSLVGIAEEMKRRGEDPQPLLSDFGFSIEGLSVPMARVNRDKAIAFVQEANQSVKEPTLHLYGAPSAPLGTYHIADYFTMFAPTIGCGYRVTLSNAHIFDTTMRCTITEEADDFVVTMTHVDGGRVHPVEVECVFPTFALRTHWLCGGECEPSTIRFSRRPAGDLDDLMAHLKCRIEVSDLDCDQLIVPKQIWRSRSIYANPTMHSIIDKLIINPKDKRNATKLFLMRLEAAIASNLNLDANIDKVSRVLAMSSRTLQRRLNELGVRFREVAAAARHRHSIRLLQNPSSTTLDIALRLGYSNATSFGRAFRNTTGYTPTEFRKLPKEAQNQIEASLRADKLAEQRSATD